MCILLRFCEYCYENIFLRYSNLSDGLTMIVPHKYEKPALRKLEVNLSRLPQNYHLYTVFNMLYYHVLSKIFPQVKEYSNHMFYFN